MTRVFSNEQFESFSDRDSGATFSDLEFRDCYFEGCILSVTEDPALRSTVRRARLVGCSQRGCTIYPGVFEDVLIEDFNTNGQLLQVWGGVFNQVVLRGKIDRLMISHVVDIYDQQSKVQRAFDDANSQYYQNIDWAIDISEASFKELDIRGLPAHLIRRDRATQAVVKRENMTGIDWISIPQHEGLWQLTIKHSYADGYPDVILAAPKRHPKFRQYLEDIQTLRKAGIAEPD